MPPSATIFGGEILFFLPNSKSSIPCPGAMCTNPEPASSVT